MRDIDKTVKDVLTPHGFVFKKVPGTEPQMVLFRLSIFRNLNLQIGIT